MNVAHFLAATAKVFDPTLVTTDARLLTAKGISLLPNRQKLINLDANQLTRVLHASMLIACQLWFRSGMYPQTCIASSRRARRSKACPSRTTCSASCATRWTALLLMKSGGGCRRAGPYDRIPHQQRQCREEEPLIVVDASAIVEVLLQTPAARRATPSFSPPTRRCMLLISST